MYLNTMRKNYFYLALLILIILCRVEQQLIVPYVPLACKVCC